MRTRGLARPRDRKILPRRGHLTAPWFFLPGDHGQTARWQKNPCRAWRLFHDACHHGIGKSSHRKQPDEHRASAAHRGRTRARPVGDRAGGAGAVRAGRCRVRNLPPLRAGPVLFDLHVRSAGIAAASDADRDRDDYPPRQRDDRRDLDHRDRAGPGRRLPPPGRAPLAGDDHPRDRRLAGADAGAGDRFQPIPRGGITRARRDLHVPAGDLPLRHPARKTRKRDGVAAHRLLLPAPRPAVPVFSRRSTTAPTCAATTANLPSRQRRSGPCGSPVASGTSSSTALSITTTARPRATWSISAV